ncbi:MULTISPECIES: hypothetical protein [Vibrio]|uniref:hypothetical protein n=1 Tax=Vibrio TaxID=662 RepID=UPI000C850C0F|nr:hypothetical protein [Vibrio cyclitrophicus]PME25547.1 hypothetical protein BCV41_16970 [Vibrio cyclitrophicus]
MPINFNDCDISENDIGVKTPSSANLSFEKTRIKNNKIGVDVYVNKEDIVALGLPEDTDPEYVKEALTVLKENHTHDDDVKRLLLSKTKLFQWLGDISSLTTIATALIQLASN